MTERILYIVPTLGKGGAEVLTVSLAREGKSRGDEILVASLGDPIDPYLAEILRDSGIELYKLGKRRGFAPGVLSEVARLIGRFAPTIVHSHLHVTKYVSLARLLYRDFAWVHTIHNVPNQDAPGIHRLINRLAIALGARFVAISEQLSASSSLYYGSKIPYVVNGVQIPTAVGARTVDTSIPVRFVNIGRAYPVKNQKLLIEAAARLQVEGLDFRLAIAGDGPLIPDLREQVARYGLTGNVEIKGLVDDIQSLLLGSDIFVLSSDWEGLPISMLEAMTHGLPIISTRVGAVPEVLNGGTCGILIQPGNVGELAGAMRRLVLDPEERHRLGRLAVSRATLNYGITATYSNYITIAKDGRA